MAVFIPSYLLLSKTLSPVKTSLSATPSISSAKMDTSVNPNYKATDINRDGKVDFTDRQFIDNNLGCKKQSPCWTKVIGKTMDGDNPIYASDLDLNKDNVIDKLDGEMIKK